MAKEAAAAFMARRNRFVWLGYVVSWGLLTLLTAFTAWQAHSATIYLAALLIANPTLRPSGWNSGTLVGVSKLAVLLWGSFWLIAVYYIEYQLRESTHERRLLKQSGQFALILLSGLAIAYLLAFV